MLDDKEVITSIERTIQGAIRVTAMLNNQLVSHQFFGLTKRQAIAEFKETYGAKYELITYDTWGNAKDGFNVNDAHYTGKTVTIYDPANTTDYQINRLLNVHGITWHGEPDYSLYGDIKRNGKPVLELRKV